MKSKKGTWGSIIALAIFLGSKLKFLALFAKLLKVPTLISMFISVGLYAMVYGWKFAVGFVYLIFMHEMGHLIAMKKQGLPVKPAIFIPFVGAVISVDPRQIKTAKMESYIAFGGPILGAVAFLPFAALYWFTHEPLWGVLMFVGAFLNLFNLAPISPLDGGRIVGVLSTKLWFIGLLGMIVYAFLNPSPVMILIIIFGCFALVDRRRQIKTREELIRKTGLYSLELEQTQLLLNKIRPLIEQIEKDEANSLAEKETLEQIIEEHKEKSRSRLEEAKEQHKTYKNLDYFKERKAKHEIQKNEIERTLFEKKYQSLDTIFFRTEIIKYKEYVEETLKSDSEELERLKGYYDTDGKTKWLVLIAYLLLVVFLAVFVGYGHDIMELHRDEVIR